MQLLSAEPVSGGELFDRIHGSERALNGLIPRFLRAKLRQQFTHQTAHRHSLIGGCQSRQSIGLFLKANGQVLHARVIPGISEAFQEPVHQERKDGPNQRDDEDQEQRKAEQGEQDFLPDLFMWSYVIGAQGNDWS